MLILVYRHSVAYVLFACSGAMQAKSNVHETASSYIYKLSAQSVESSTHKCVAGNIV